MTHLRIELFPDNDEPSQVQLLVVSELIQTLTVKAYASHPAH